jgi:hypothetical protein
VWCILHHPEVLLGLCSPTSGKMGELVHQDPSIAPLGRSWWRRPCVVEVVV